jgi:hypothetical protein
MASEPAGELEWQRTGCEGGACVEVAAIGETVMVRSSVDPGTTFRMSRDEWQKFLAGAKDGLFDKL